MSISVNYQPEAWKGMASHNIYFMETYQNEIEELGFTFNKMDVQKKLNERLERSTQNISFEMGLLYLSLEEYELAKRMFFKHLSNKLNYRERLFTYLGLVSSLIKFDLVYQYRNIRDGIKRWMREKRWQC